MKHIIAAIAFLAITAPALAQVDRAREYRMWAAEQMIKRLIDKYGQAVTANQRTLASIREAAAGDDVVLWTFIVEEIHRLEDSNAPLSAIERK